MPAVTVSDPSCLILFRKIGEFELLKNVFSQILITETVAREFNKEVPDWIEVVKLKSDLDKGLSKQ